MYPDVSLEVKALQGFGFNFENRIVGHFLSKHNNCVTEFSQASSENALLLFFYTSCILTLFLVFVC